MSARTPGSVSGTPVSRTPVSATSLPTLGDRARRWRPTRRLLLVAGLLLLALVVLVLTTPPRTGSLDPAAVDPGGSRALATLLREQGVEVLDVRTTTRAAEAAAGATVLVTDPYLPNDAMLDDVLAARPARLVLLGASPGSVAFERLASGVTMAEPAAEDPLAPGCALPAAARAGDAALPGPQYDARAWGRTAAPCYDRLQAAAVVLLESAGSGRPEVVLLGSPNPLTNAGLDEAGNAALAMNLLGAQERLVWWRPSFEDPALAGAPADSLADLLPPWVLPVVAQLLVAGLIVAAWRGRRLGPLVVEPLPVVVRAGETTAGRARLLHAQHARGEAADHLRGAARARIRRRLGLGPASPPAALVAATSARTGQAPGTVGPLLYGPEPADDAALVRLDHDLAALLGAVGQEVGPAGREVGRRVGTDVDSGAGRDVAEEGTGA
ncbi:MAG TPA: DUF4350 domain-containing protein [Candidatus Nanopelagicales bacterium]